MSEIDLGLFFSYKPFIIKDALGQLYKLFFFSDIKSKKIRISCELSKDSPILDRDSYSLEYVCEELSIKAWTYIKIQNN